MNKNTPSKKKHSKNMKKLSNNLYNSSEHSTIKWKTGKNYLKHIPINSQNILKRKLKISLFTSRKSFKKKGKEPCAC